MAHNGTEAPDLYKSHSPVKERQRNCKLSQKGESDGGAQFDPSFPEILRGELHGLSTRLPLQVAERPNRRHIPLGTRQMLIHE
jgi:hypothetical protein